MALGQATGFTREDPLGGQQEDFGFIASRGTRADCFHNTLLLSSALGFESRWQMAYKSNAWPTANREVHRMEQRLATGIHYTQPRKPSLGKNKQILWAISRSEEHT